MVSLHFTSNNYRPPWLNHFRLLYSSFASVGQVPSGLTRAIVTPIYKGGSASGLSNCRIISLTSVACKMVERIVVTDLLDYLRVNEIISNHQRGFLYGKSTCTNLLEALNDWTLAIKNRRSVTVAFMEYQKAFDAVSHNKLLAKLDSYLVHLTSLIHISGVQLMMLYYYY